MSKTLLSAYLWGYDRPHTADVIFRKFREFYKDGNLYFKMDVGGKEKEHKEICEKYESTFSVQPMKVGRCGWMIHYEEWEDGSGEVLKGVFN